MKNLNLYRFAIIVFSLNILLVLLSFMLPPTTTTFFGILLTSTTTGNAISAIGGWLSAIILLLTIKKITKKERNKMIKLIGTDGPLKGAEISVVEEQFNLLLKYQAAKALYGLVDQEDDEYDNIISLVTSFGAKLKFGESNVEYYQTTWSV